MSRALILGCSHAIGAEMTDEPGFALEGMEKWQYGARHSYPVLIAEALGLTPLNHAISGGSNDAMFRIFESQVSTLSHTDVVIACWTGSSRTEIWHDSDQRWIPLAAGQDSINKVIADDYMREGRHVPRTVTDEKNYLEYQKCWVSYNTTPAIGRLNKMKNIVALNALAQLHNIQVINIDNFDFVAGPPRLTKFKFPEYIYWPVPVTFCQWADELNSPCTPAKHYFYPTHKKFAEYVLEHIAQRQH